MCDVQDGRNVISCIGIYPTWKQKFPPYFYGDRNFYTPTNYKLGLTWKTKRHVELATILHNIIWPRLGRQFNLGSRFTCLFARIFRDRIGCRNWMVWGNKSSESTYRSQNVLEVRTPRRAPKEVTAAFWSENWLIKLPLHELSCQWFLLSLHR